MIVHEYSQASLKGWIDEVDGDTDGNRWHKQLSYSTNATAATWSIRISVSLVTESFDLSRWNLVIFHFSTLRLSSPKRNNNICCSSKCLKKNHLNMHKSLLADIGIVTLVRWEEIMGIVEGVWNDAVSFHLLPILVSFNHDQDCSLTIANKMFFFVLCLNLTSLNYSGVTPTNNSFEKPIGAVR